MIMNNAVVKAEPRRVDWTDPDDIEAMIYVALGQSTARILRSVPSLTAGQLQYRMRKAGMRISHYRSAAANTVGGQIAEELIQQARRRYRGMVTDHLQRERPRREHGCR